MLKKGGQPPVSPFPSRLSSKPKRGRGGGWHGGIMAGKYTGVGAWGLDFFVAAHSCP